MSVTATTLAILNWGRQYIPDPKTRLKSVRGEEIGRTALPTSSRESFYYKRSIIGSLFLYVDPYQYSSTASLGAASATDKVFLHNATLQKCTFPASTDPSIRPDQFKAVLADYEYYEKLPYAYSDKELTEFLPNAISYLNNNFNQSYTYTGTISTFTPGFTSDSAKEIVARALAVLVRNSFSSEQIRRGLGVAFRGPLAAIDSKTQLKEYNDATKRLEQSIKDKIESDRVGASDGGAETVDWYDETVVTS